MPSAPLYYQPLVQARVLATPIGDTNVYEAQKVQVELTQKNYEQFAPAMDQILRGFEGMQASMPGSKSLDMIQFSFDDAGYVANRVATYMRLHPEAFDVASPDQAAEMGAKLVQEAQKELDDNPGMKAVGDTLEVAPDVTHILRNHWEGKRPLMAEEAAYLGVTAARELQRAVTPLGPDETHPQLQWMEDATAWMLGMWPGAASKTVEALGIKADAKEIESLVDGWRSNMGGVEPKVEAPIRSLTALLGAAGITGSDDAARDAAYQVLQGSPLEGVPTAVAQSIIAAQELPEEQAGYVAGRIVETGGTEGNVKGLLAELELMKRPAPGVPPPVDEPPTGEEPPPAGETPPQPPPGEEPPPPVNPPTGEEPPAGETPPPSEEPPAGETPPPSEEPPAGETPPPSEEPPVGETPPPAVQPPAGEQPAPEMTEAELQQLMASIMGQVEAPGAPHGHQH